MALTERLQILIDADAKGAQREFAAFGRNAERELGRTDKKLQQLSGQMIAFGSTTLVAGGVAAAGLFKLAQASSNLGEAQNAANVVLGKEGAAALESYADTAAKTAGVSKRAALEYGASFSLFVEKAGFVGQEAGKVSADLVQLAGDISSLRNVPIDEALGSVQSALAGETESIRRFGIDVSDATLKQEIFARTGEKVTGTLTQQQKVQEIINQLYQQGAVFAGDFASTSDSLANRQRALSAELENAAAAAGAGLLPAFEKLVGGVSALTSEFSDLDPAVQSGIGSVAGVATGGALAAGSLALAAGQAIKLKTSFASLTTQSAALRATLAGPVPFLLGLGIVGGTLTVLDEVTGRTEALATATSDLQEALAKGDPALKRFTERATTKDSFLSELNPFDTDAFDALTKDSITFADGTVAQFSKVRDAVDEAAQGGVRSLRELQNQVEEQRGTVERNTVAWRDYGRILDLIDQKRREDFPNPDLGNATGRALALANGATDKNTDSTEANAQAQEQASEAADKLKAALGRLTAQQKLNTLAFDTGAAKAESFTAALERSTYADDLATSSVAAGKALRDIQKGIGLIPQEADDAADSTDYAAEAMGRLRDAADRADPAMSRLGIALGASQAAAQAFGESLEGAAGFGNRLGTALDVGEAFDEFSKTFRRLPDDIDIAGISLGKLRPRTADAVRNVLALGDGTRQYLKTLLETGASADQVRAEAARLRGEYAAQLRQLGLNEEQLQRYLQLTGTAPDEIETAIRLSGLEASQFKLNAYLQLLEGRIPPEVATSLVAQVDAGDIEGAARRLSEVAASNPPMVDIGVNTKGLREAEEITLGLPAKFDAIAAATGRYTDEQYAGLDALESLSGAAQQYLSDLVASGAPLETVRGEAAKLREAYEPFFAEFGIFGDDLATYEQQILGISDTQITAAFELANFDATVFQITTVTALLEGMDKLDPSVSLRIQDMLLREDWEGVKALLGETVETQLFLDTEEGKAKVEELTGRIEDMPGISEDAKAKILAELDQGNLTGTENLLNALARDRKARLFVELQESILEAPANAGPRDGRLYGQRRGIWDRPDGIPDFINPSSGGGGFLGGSATGGMIQGVGNGTSDSVPWRVSNGEFVVRAAAVRGNELALEALNRTGRWPGEDAADAIGGVQRSLASPPPLSDARESVDRMMAQISDHLIRNGNGDTYIQEGAIQVNANEPREAGSEVIRRMRRL